METVVLMIEKAVGSAVNSWLAAVLTDGMGMPRTPPTFGVLEAARLDEVLGKITAEPPD